LYETRTSRLNDLAKSSIADISVGIQELSVIESIEELSPELEHLILTESCFFNGGEIKINYSWSATNSAR
jgi:hypothetical protein